MAQPSQLTSPLSTKAVNDPEVAAQLNIDLNEQNIANAAATTLVIDPTKGSLVNVTSTTASAVTISITATPQGTIQPGQRLTILYSSSAVTPASPVAGSGIHFAATAPALTQSKVTVIELRYDSLASEFKQISANVLS